MFKYMFFRNYGTLYDKKRVKFDKQILKMKTLFSAFVSTVFMVFSLSDIPAQQLSATEIIRKADEKFNGEKSNMMVMSMTIVRPSWKRTVEFKNAWPRLCPDPDNCTFKGCRSDLSQAGK